MGYLFVALALAAGIVKGFCGKKTGGELSALSSVMLFTTVRMCICIPIGLLFVLSASASLAVSHEVLLASLVSGIATSVFVVSWIAIVRRGAYMLVEVFLTLGVAVPTLFSLLFFDEEVRWNQWVGILLLLAAVYIMSTYNRTLKGRMRPSDVLLLSVCGLASGGTQLAQKWFSKVAAGTDAAVFNFYTYVFSAVLLLLCYFTVRFAFREAPEKLQRGAYKRLAVFVSLMSLCLFLHSYFSTLASEHLTAAEQFPLMQGGSLSLSLFMAAIFFKERINFRAILGVLIAFAALLCINLL